MKTHILPLFRGLLLAAAALSLSNCATSPEGSFATAPASPAMESAYSPAEGSRLGGSRGLRFGSDELTNNAIDALIAGVDAESMTPASRKKNRPGLATQDGGERWDQLTVTEFYRKPQNSPDAVDSFNYNDETGAKAMADALGGGRRKGGAFGAAGGRVEVGLRAGSWGSPYERYEAGSRRIVIGKSGSRYEIFLKNNTRHALEIVASVDGLGVMDGKAASVKKRGYILPAKAEIAISGFRLNSDKVKAFLFGSVDNSAASKAGMARNVGVIGLAIYEEDEAQAKLARLVESQKRGAADAFPVNAR